MTRKTRLAQGLQTLMVDEQGSFIPTGLTRRLFDRLAACVDVASSREPTDLLREADEHLERVFKAHQRNPLLNHKLAQAMCRAMQTVIEDWGQVPPFARCWLLGAMHYFALDDDEEPDFASPIGFEDDAEVLNACLRLAGRDDLCLNTEDYDDV